MNHTERPERDLMRTPRAFLRRRGQTGQLEVLDEGVGDTASGPGLVFTNSAECPALRRVRRVPYELFAASLHSLTELR